MTLTILADPRQPETAKKLYSQNSLSHSDPIFSCTRGSTTSREVAPTRARSSSARSMSSSSPPRGAATTCSASPLAPTRFEVDEGLLRVVAAAIEAAGAESAAPQPEPLDAAQQAQPLHHQAAPQQAQPTQVATASHPPQLAAMAQPLRAAAPAGRRVLLSVGAVVPTQAASSALPPGWRRGRTQAATHDDEGSGSSSAPLPCPR